MGRAWTGVIAACVVCVIVNLFSGCQAAKTAGEIAAVEAAYQAELAGCIAMAKADSGTYQEYNQCACLVDQKYRVDAGVCP